MKKTLFIGLMCAAAALYAAPASAASAPVSDLHNWQVRLRGINVAPDESSSVSNGGKISVGNRVAPELDISYFFTDAISAELILATTKHSVSEKGPNIDLGHVWVLPPTLTLQYHIDTGTAFVPYVGAGVNYTMFYNAKPGAASSIKYDNKLGYAFQIGADYKLDKHWMLNADVKKIMINTDASVAGGAVKADVDLDPWVVGVGVGYRF